MTDKTTENMAYSFSQLSSEAQQYAIDREKAVCVSYALEYAVEDIKEAGACLGFEISDVYYQLHCQGQGACIVGEFRRENVKPEKLVYPNKTLMKLGASILAEIPAESEMYVSIKHHGLYYHEYSMSYSMSLASDFEYGSDDDSDGLTSDQYRGYEEAIEEFTREFCQWAFNKLSAEARYQSSDEGIREMLTDSWNEYNKDGSSYCPD